MAILWPWTIKTKIESLEAENVELRDSIKRIEKVLIDKRIANFIRIVTYRQGMDLSYTQPKPISLEDLEKRINQIEKEKK